MIFFQTKPVFMAGFVSSGAHEIFTVYPLSFTEKNAIISYLLISGKEGIYNALPKLRNRNRHSAGIFRRDDRLPGLRHDLSEKSRCQK